jgi:hypothetical protein
MAKNNKYASRGKCRNKKERKKERKKGEVVLS